MLKNNKLKSYQLDFIEFAIRKNALQFGEFTLKSGRVSPYFFNAGLFNDGLSLANLGNFYAQALMDSAISFDVLFGPAYKGIPLASATAVCLSSNYQKNIPFAFNRKEAKTHGEGGTLVGAPLAGKIMVIDDVITAGTAIREIFSLIATANAEPAGVIIALDRQEKGQSDFSAIQEIETKLNIPVISIVNLTQVLNYIQTNTSLSQHAQAIANYRTRYGIEN